MKLGRLCLFAHNAVAQLYTREGQRLEGLTKIVRWHFFRAAYLFRILGMGYGVLTVEIGF